MNASYLQCPVQRVGLSSAFHFHATFYYNKSTTSGVTAMSLRKESASRSWGGFPLYNRKHGKTHEPFREGTENKQRRRSVNPSILPFWRLHAPTIAHLSFSFWSLASSVSPLSLCQISFSPTEPASRKFQDHLQEFTVSIASYLELYYKKYYLAVLIKN